MPMADILRSRGILQDSIHLPPPDPSPSNGHAPRDHGRLPENASTPPSLPPLGSTRRELEHEPVPDRPEAGSPRAEGGSSSASSKGGLGDVERLRSQPLRSRRPSPCTGEEVEADVQRAGTSRSASTSPGVVLESPARLHDVGRPCSPQQRSTPPHRPSPDGEVPAPPKRPRQDDAAGCSSPPRGGRHERDGGRRIFTGHHPGAEDRTVDGKTEFPWLSACAEHQQYDDRAYITSQKRAYFDLHKDEIWLKEMYHPINLLSVIERRNEFRKAAAKSLILELESGTLDLGPGMIPGSKSRNDSLDCGKKRRKKGRGPPKETGSVPTAPEAHPVSSQDRRIQTDIDQTRALVQKLDAEKGIVGNILSTSDHGNFVGSMGPIVIVRGLTTVKGLEGVELLDTLLTYLWRVHAVDYYGMFEMKDAKGLRHVRAVKKSANAFDISASDWEKEQDSFWHGRLTNGKDPLVLLTAKDKIDAAIYETVQTYVSKILDEKYECGAEGCSEVFHDPELVHKHLTLNHPDLVSLLTSRVQDDIYFQNYMKDPNAPGGNEIPVMQKSSPERLQSKNMRDGIGRAPDEHVFGDFGVQWSNALFPQFPIPRLLIPAPGAGPLGPFVPAPPEMAMQMIRQQGPPGSNGVLPCLPMYPSFPHYPRPM